MDNTIFDKEIFDNPVFEYAFCLGILLFGFVFKRFGASFISKQSFRILKKFSDNQFSEVFVQLERKPLEQLITLLILYFAFDRLHFPDSWHLVVGEKIGLRWFISTVYDIALLTVITRMILRGTEFFAFVVRNREDSPMTKELATFLKELSKVVIVILAIFAGLRFIFSVNITALVASLGIGGLAVALAAQDTLANLLGSFIIYLDKPFKAGDQIETGEIKGTVEHVGFRTTRIRTFDKTLLTVPNKKMIDSALNNISQSDNKRVNMTLSLKHGSKTDSIVHIVNEIKNLIEINPRTTNDCIVHFTDVDQRALNITIIYFVIGNDAAHMLAVKEEMNLQFIDCIYKNGCELATYNVL
ncbi:MAG: mechanosensitive ion channel family protein [Bacteroidota bacterium]